jgi:hypothetical protein
MFPKSDTGEALLAKNEDPAYKMNLKHLAALKQNRSIALFYREFKDKDLKVLSSH